MQIPKREIDQALFKQINLKKAEPLYEELNTNLRNEGFKVETGVFGADMDVALVNDGPVTILIDSKNK